MADKDKHPPTNDRMDASKPKKKKSAKGKSTRKAAGRKGKGSNSALGEADGGVVQTSGVSDVDARARERIAAAASAAAAQLSAKQPSGVSALLGDDIDRLIEPPPPDPALLDEPDDDSAAAASTAATDMKAPGTPDTTPSPRPAPIESDDTRPNDPATPPDRIRDPAIEQTAAPTGLVSKSSPGRWSTPLLLLLLAVAGFFYVRAILPIQTANDRQPPVSTGAETPAAGTASPEPSTPNSGSVAVQPNIDAPLIETPSPQRPLSETNANPVEPKLKPLPAEQMDLIKRAFAPEQHSSGSPPSVEDRSDETGTSSR